MGRLEGHQRTGTSLDLRRRLEGEKKRDLSLYIYLLGGLGEEDAADALLGLQQLLHQHPVQRRDQPLRHCSALPFPSVRLEEQVDGMVA